MQTIKIPTNKGTLTAREENGGIRIVLENVSAKAEHPLADIRCSEDHQGNIVTTIYAPSGEPMEIHVHEDQHDETSCLIIGKESDVVYICSPYAGQTEGQRERNIANACKYGRFALSQGYVPLIAHLAVCGYLNDDIPRQRSIGIKADQALLAGCSEMWVFGETRSPGMKAEIEFCEQNRIPIRYFTTDLKEITNKGEITP